MWGRTREALLLVLVVFALAGCAITIQQPTNNATIALPSRTKVVVTGNASYTGLKVAVDGVDFSNLMVSTGSGSYEGEFTLAAGPHTVSASAEVYCWYCAGGKTQSTDTKSFIVSGGLQVCARPSGGPAVIALDPSVVTAGRQPGRQLIGYQLKNGTDRLLIIVDDAPTLTPTQMQVELDIDPFNGVTSSKAIEAWSFCRSGSRVDLVEASMLTGFNVGTACAQATAANDFRSGCTNTKTMLLNQSTTSELWLRNEGFPGIWVDAEAIDASMWQAFGGRSLRFVWRSD
jgi:putative hemolysin